MKIEIWSDYVCPFCYIGKRNLEIALEQTGTNKDVEIVFKSFELNPNAHKHYEKNINQLIADKYGMTIERAAETNNRIINTAKVVGLEYNFDNLQPTNTFDAHRLSHYAKAEGKLNEYTEALMKSYFTESLNISDFSVLISIADTVGLNKEDAERILKSSDYSAEVRREESDAYNIGVTGVPYFLFDEKEKVNGAQPVEAFVQVINKLNYEE